MQIVLPVIVVFFLLLLIVPIFSKVYVTFDILNNIGVLSIYVLFIKIFAYKIKREGKEIILFTEKDKKEVQLKVSKKQLRFLKQLSVQLKEKILLKRAVFYSRIGLNDAYLTALGTGFINVLVSMIMGYVKNTKKSARMQVINIPEFNGQYFAIAAHVTCFITLFDIIYAFVMSFLIIKRSEKYERV
ncbi:MAG: DUF2953 domain-containing protein [Clostridiales bacterium]|nr:DUF2953 domain-containing protein [Clostridiales bacterium]